MTQFLVPAGRGGGGGGAEGGRRGKEGGGVRGVMLLWAAWLSERDNKTTF